MKNYKDYLEDPEKLATLGNYFIQTYCLQRQFLNNLESIPRINDVLENWPILLNSNMMETHFFYLTNIAKNLVIQEYNLSVPLILAYGEAFQNRTIEKNATNSEKFVDCLKVIFKHFKEKFEDLFVSVPVSIS